MIYGATAYGQVEYGGVNDVFTAVSIYDSITVSEYVAINVLTYIDTNDSITISENIVNTGYSVIDVYDNIIVSEGGEPPILISSYNETNRNDYDQLFGTYYFTGGQTFLNINEIRLKECEFFLSKSGSPTGSAVAKLYSHTGTFGYNGKPDLLLATSDIFDVSTLTTSYQLTTFNFSDVNKVVLNSATDYCIAVEYTGGDNFNRINIGNDSSSPAHPGNYFLKYFSSSTWSTFDTKDAIFYIYGDDNGVPAIRVISYIDSIDSITILEDIKNDAVLLVNVNDSITVSEDISTSGQQYDVEFESVSVSEDILLSIPVLFISNNESITVSENINSVITVLFISDNESITVSENINLVIPFLLVSVNDSITISESLTVFLPFFCTVSYDSIDISENISVFIPILFVDEHEVISVLEDVTPLIPILLVDTYELIDVLENFQSNIVSYISTSDSITVSESIVCETAIRSINYPFPAGSTYYPYSLVASGSYGVI